MGSLKAYILDVGHGSCTVICGESDCIVVDVGSTTVLLKFLKTVGVQRVTALFLSHADADHIGGVVGLFAAGRIAIDHLYLNPDADKTSTSFMDLRYALKQLNKMGKVRVHSTLNSGDPGQVSYKEFSVEVLSPDLAEALAGVGHVREDRTVVSANDHSVVLRICSAEVPLLLLLSDMTGYTWQRLRTESIAIDAQVVALPHHGGSFSSDPGDYKEMLARVSPKYAVASNGRNQYDNPRMEVVSFVREYGAEMVCTQLSRRCAEKAPPRREALNLPGSGVAAGSSCAGSLTFEFSNTNLVFKQEDSHTKFVDAVGGSAMCRFAPSTAAAIL